MDVPALNDITIVTGGDDGVDREAERQAVHFGTQLDVVIGPHHPRRRTITLLTKEDLEKTIYHFLSAQVQLERQVTSPLSVEYFCNGTFTLPPALTPCTPSVSLSEAIPK